MGQQYNKYGSGLSQPINWFYNSFTFQAQSNKEDSQELTQLQKSPGTTNACHKGF